jgi:hypothetical protein
MEFVGEKDIFVHPGLNKAIQFNQERFADGDSTPTSDHH